MLLRNALTAALCLGLAPCRDEASPAPPPPVEPAQPDETAKPGDSPPVQSEDPGEPTPSTGAEGSACLTPEDCESGICEGEGCDDEHPGTCQPRQRMCTRDLRPYCGCDDETFRTSGSCPGRRFAHRGECEGGEAVDDAMP